MHCFSLTVPVMISQITPTLYLSGVQALNQSALDHRGVTLLVNACAEYPCPEYEGVKCICVPVEDRPHAPLDQHFDSVAERINESWAHIWTAAHRQKLTVEDGVENRDEAEEYGLYQQQKLWPGPPEKGRSFYYFHKKIMRVYNETRSNVRDVANTPRVNVFVLWGASLVLFSQITCYFLTNALADAKALVSLSTCESFN